VLKIKTLLIILATLAVGEALLGVAGYVTLSDARPVKPAESAIEATTPIKNHPIAMGEWYNRLEQWRLVRERGDTSATYAYYTPDFRNVNGETFDDLKDEVEAHFRRFDWRKITLDSVRLAAEDGSRILTFRERYYCSGFYLNQMKTLWFAERDSVWKIVAEKDSNLVSPQYPDQFIPRFVSAWRNAWESTNFQHYISYYDSSFQTGAYTFESWVAHKKQLFEDADNIRVDVSDFEFTNTAPEKWKVAFIQRYMSPSHEDWGQKVLKIQGHPGNFKITHETWVPLQAYAQ